MAISLSTLPRIKKASKKRRGRGYSSGKGGHTVGHGQKGYKARHGGKSKPGFEGGQSPLIKRLPRTGGFKSKREKPNVVYTYQLKDFKNGEIITPNVLKKTGIIEKISKTGVKIIKKGEVDKKFKFAGDIQLSKGAKELVGM